MKKILTISLLSITSLFSTEYMAQLNPIKEFEIKAQSSGIVSYVNTNLEAKYIENNKTILKIDSKDEDIELEKEKVSFNIQSDIVKIKEKNYKSKARVSQLSAYSKNVEKLSLLEAKKELINTKRTIKKLQNDKNKKKFTAKNIYIATIYKDKGEYVNIGDKIYDAYDFSKIKISLYLTEEEILNINNKRIYIDKNLSEFKISKVFKIKDTIKISRYKVELTKTNKNIEDIFFGKVVKVEIK